MRVERETERRGNAAAVITTLLSLLVVAAAVGVVAWLVLRTPSSAVDSAERLDPIGTALPAPTDQPILPTLEPTPDAQSVAEPEPTALGFTGEQPPAAGLPTAAANEPEATATAAPAGPTPTPRVIAQPTAPPATAVPTLPPAPTLPPSIPVTQVPVVALEPIEAAPPTAAPVSTRAVTEPTPVPSDDDDPFNIFDDDARSRIVDVQDDPMEIVRAMQEEREAGRSVVPTFAPGSERRRESDDDPVVVDIPEIIASSADNDRDSTDDTRTITRRDEPNVIVPDVDAMIEEITARATDPDRNPNARDDGRRITSRDDDDEDADDEDDENLTPAERRRKAIRDRIRERAGRGNTNSGVTVPVVPRPGNARDDDGPCLDPTAPGFPFDC